MAATMAVRNRTLIRWMSKLHTFFYRLTGGWIGGSMFGLPVLLLTHKGRKSGNLFTTPLMHVRDGERWVLVASNAASPKDPAWSTNLAANADARIQVKRERFDVRARVAVGEERARLFEAAKRAWDGYAEYERATLREIPVVVLEARKP
jgi:deazaflavin-dependent oxidoreductase (nitroreductase family)